MRSWINLVFLATASMVVLGACGTSAPAATPTEGPNARADTDVQAYLALMDELAIELTLFSNPDGGGGSIEGVIDLASKLEEYVPFFFGLDGELREYVFSTYERQLEETAIRVGNLLVMVNEITEIEGMASALQHTPAFAPDITDN